MGKNIQGLFSEPRELTMRQVAVWIRHLPHDSALAVRNIAGESKYTLQEQMAASTINELRQANYIFKAANMDEKDAKDLEDPEFIILE